MIQKSLSQVFDILFPAHCIVCHRRLRGKALCHSCLPKAIGISQAIRCYHCFTITHALDESGRCPACRLVPLAVNRMRYLWEYHDQARDLITTMKYQPSPMLNRIAAQMLYGHLPELFDQPDWDLAIPVPSSPASIRKRTFNQCVPLARAVVKAFPRVELQIDSRSLKYCGSGVTQASLHGAPRLRNAKSSFVAEAKRVNDRAILLVDDVITTGATSTACAVALLDAGAARVDLVALARANNWHDFRYDIYQQIRSSPQ